MSDNRVEIYPVIEISPWHIAGTDELKMKEGQGYNEFALQVFKKQGLRSITRLDPNAYSSVRISDINDGDLNYW